MTTPPDPQALENILSADANHVARGDLQTWLMAEVNLPRLSQSLDACRSVNTKLYAFWYALEENMKTPAVVVREFDEWSGSSDEFVAYVEARPTYFDALKQKPAARSQKIGRARSKAMEKAFALTRQYPQFTAATGKTIACFVEVESGRYWVARSGRANHEVAGAVERMSTLLEGVHQVEEWGIDVCAEVDCMKQALTADPAVAEGDIVYYCFTWNGRRWTGKTACGNCRQWLAKLPKPE